ncbi:MAG: outer membrane protein transport protein [Candidatus Omnitrophota bacterium]
MKRPLFIFLAIFTLLFAITTRAHANAYKTWGVGSRSVGMGGAFIGQADDWTAIYWNPAGLTQLKKSGASAEPGYLYLKMTDGNSARNFSPAALGDHLQGDTFLNAYGAFGFEPEQFDRNSSVYSGASPASAFGAFASIEPVTIAIGMYTPAGLQIDLASEVADAANANARIEMSFHSSVKVTSYSVAVGVPVHKKVSVGLGVNILALETNINAKKRYFNAALPDYDFRYREKSFGIGAEPIIGVMANITDKLQIGGVYRFGAKIQSLGQAEARHTALGVNQDSPYRQTYYYPSSMGVGLAYNPFPKFTLTADWEYTNWRKLNRKITYDRKDLVMSDVDFDWEWTGSSNYSVGMEYDLLPYLSLRGGIRYDESPLSDTSVSITNVVDVDKVWYTTGITFAKDNYSLDFAYAYTYGEDTILGEDYSILAHNVMLGAKYQF